MSHGQDSLFHAWRQKFDRAEEKLVSGRHGETQIAETAREPSLYEYRQTGSRLRDRRHTFFAPRVLLGESASIIGELVNVNHSPGESAAFAPLALAKSAVRRSV
jgi:hypothetical protein